jgi:hypothetical protein
MAPNKKDDKPGKNDGEGALKQMLKKYIAMFPLVRSNELGKIITEPDKEMPNEIEKATVGQGLADAIITSMIFTFVLSAFYLIFSIPTLMQALKAIPDTIILMVLGVMVMSVAFGAMSAAVGLLLTSIVYIIMAKILGGKGTFAKTMGMLGIISAPINLINIALVVIAGIVAAIIGMVSVGALWLVYVLVLLAGIGLCLFQLYLNYKMVRLLHQLSKWRAIAVVAIPVLVLLTVIAAFAFWVASMVAAAASMVPH